VSKTYEHCLSPKNLPTFQDCLNRDDLDNEIIDHFDQHSVDFGQMNGHDHGHTADQREVAFEHPCLELKKILSSGTFYYSVDFDLTNRLQDR